MLYLVLDSKEQIIARLIHAIDGEIFGSEIAFSAATFDAYLMRACVNIDFDIFFDINLVSGPNPAALGQ